MKSFRNKFRGEKSISDRKYLANRALRLNKAKCKFNIPVFALNYLGEPVRQDSNADK